jgi:membrane associated rhomboid family serine protease
LFITFVEDSPASRKIPWANTGVMFLCVVVAWMTLGRTDFMGILGTYGFIPANPFLHFGVGIITSPFIHSSWTQLVANMTFLFMFGKGVEERVGPKRYLLAFALCCLAGEAFHWYYHPKSTLALIGASRAVTGLGVMYLFYFPWGRMKWILSFFGVPLIEFPSRTAYVMGLWAGVQAALAFLPWSRLTQTVKALSKFGGSVFTINPTAGIAWDAHLGAVVAGIVLFFLMPEKKGKG